MTKYIELFSFLVAATILTVLLHFSDTPDHIEDVVITLCSFVLGMVAGRRMG